ncbi:MraY family glycosyltransferase [Algoriphagus sediminis]|uniref:Glycosyltransferase family 4 protein n=1 Tax=Algoriphagus sediminis TaxID=3057113 RepID=A0ABT7YDY6_9BACT|nr:glycosyltransferase family 4 protein [Algoriphagus sediminis]MDN3204729.1 glycosyltransferase family 4 protein [Algoriphagus sediminis]
MVLSQIIVFLILLLLSLIYHRLAKKFGIVDKPNHRSSHSHLTVRGGGIIFPCAAVLWWFSYDFQHTWMIIGLLWVSAISMLDDIYSLSGKLRMTVQFIALSMAFYDLGLFEQMSWWSLPILYFIGLGILNAINFMDGINGISGLYAAVFFGTILAVNTYLPIFEVNLINYEILAIAVFLIFNLRKKAIMFAGDIGSISLGYLMIYYLADWYLYSGDWTIIILLMVYGMDAFLTLANRIRKKEDIGEPHRSHLYQLLVNKAKAPHVIIALAYAGIQFGINILFFVLPQDTPSPYAASIILVAAAVIYIGGKSFVERKFATDS